MSNLACFMHKDKQFFSSRRFRLPAHAGRAGKGIENDLSQPRRRSDAKLSDYSLRIGRHTARTRRFTLMQGSEFVEYRSSFLIRCEFSGKPELIVAS